MIAVLIHPGIVLAGVSIPEHRTLEVVEDLGLDDGDGERDVLTSGEARALVQAGYADAIEPDFDRLSEILDGWQRA
jgi:hypothetical protein